MSSPQFPLSSGQTRLWVIDQLDPGNPAYNLTRVLRITGELRNEVLEASLRALVDRHESLRMTFAAVDDEPAISVAGRGLPFKMDSRDLEIQAGESEEQAVGRIAGQENLRPFDLASGPLFRATLVRLSGDVHVLLLTFHHIIIDGWSIEILLGELGEIYQALASGREPALEPVALDYTDYARWQQESLTEERLAEHKRYWLEVLDGAPPVLELPADRRRPPVQSHKGGRHSLKLDAELTRRIAAFSKSEGATPFMTLRAALETLLWRYSGFEDFVIGTPVAGRDRVEFEKLVGMFVSTLPLRANLSGNPTFRELLRRVKQSTLDAFEHTDAPFEKLVEALHTERSLSHTPVFQVMLVVQTAPRHPAKISGTRIEELDFSPDVSKFDITLELIDLDGYYCNWEYNTDIFDADRIERMALHFEVLLRGIVANPGVRLSELPLLTAGERTTLLADWNRTGAAYPGGCIHEIFEEVAAKKGDAAAVLGERQLTFRQLNAQANQLAHYLLAAGVSKGDRVAVAVERSTDAVVALMAVIKTGAAYVAIDPAYPSQRIAFMLQDSRSKVLITQPGLRGRLPEHAGATIELDRDSPVFSGQSTENCGIQVEPGDVAYIIYTSGSTGAPKGVMGTHRASINRFSWMWKAYPFKEGDVCSQQTSLSFVDSIWEVFGPLLAGVPIFVMPDEAVRDPNELVRNLAARRVTRMGTVPSLMKTVLSMGGDLAGQLPHLRLCVMSGEAMPFDLYERFAGAMPQTTLLNLYGSSEVAADVTCFDTSRSKPAGFVPIGKPISNARVYILDAFRNPAPVGVPGELYAGGDCLAQGYFDRPELTAERFVADPFTSGTSGDRLYRTGDLARYGRDGNIEYLGRIDAQVKIRGIRVEPGEIEGALRSHAAVADCAVVSRTGASLENTLVAYVVAGGEQALNHSELRRHLRTRLPEALIPSAFVTLDALPRTPNGKLDAKNLPSPEWSRSEIEGRKVAPRNDTESRLLGIWTEVLGLTDIGVLDNFFDLGGHSLLAIQVIARIRNLLQLEIPVRRLFEEPTIAGLALAAEQARSSGAIARPPIAPRKSESRKRDELAARLHGMSDAEIDALLRVALAERHSKAE